MQCCNSTMPSVHSSGQWFCRSSGAKKHPVFLFCTWTTVSSRYVQESHLFGNRNKTTNLFKDVFNKSNKINIITCLSMVAMNFFCQGEFLEQVSVCAVFESCSIPCCLWHESLSWVVLINISIFHVVD